MIVKFATRDEKRQARLPFAHDNVFLITHEAIAKLNPKMSVEEIYATARALADDLIRYDLSEREMLLYEVNDLREEAEDELSSHLILILAFMRLGALRKTHHNAEAIARGLCAYCMDYPEFPHLLQAFSKKEIRMIAKEQARDLERDGKHKILKEVKK